MVLNVGIWTSQENYYLIIIYLCSELPWLPDHLFSGENTGFNFSWKNFLFRQTDQAVAFVFWGLCHPLFSSPQSFLWPTCSRLRGCCSVIHPQHLHTHLQHIKLQLSLVAVSFLQHDCTELCNLFSPSSCVSLSMWVGSSDYWFSFNRPDLLSSLLLVLLLIKQVIANHTFCFFLSLMPSLMIPPHSSFRILPICSSYTLLCI